MINKKIFLVRPVTISMFLIFFQQVLSQPVLEPWGNLAGIRIDGQLMQFETSLRVVNKDWSQVTATGKEKQRPKYIRNGGDQVVTTNIDSIYFTERVADEGKGVAKINVAFTGKGNQDMEGIFFCITPHGQYRATSTIQVDNAKAVLLNNNQILSNYLQSAIHNLRLVSASRQLSIGFSDAVTISIKNENDRTGSHLQIYIPIHTGTIKNGDSGQANLTIKVSGDIDKRPVAIQINTSQSGRVFDGFGGNFRLQNPATDPQVIDYSLNNLRVAWGRVEMPWRFWQPQKNSNPGDSANNGRLHPAVQHAMEMAQRLGKMGIPFILSAWSAPTWAIVGKPNFRPGPDGVWGNPLNKDSMNEIYKSIADYIFYLKEKYEVEPALFSFNESDLGINIRLTGSEHAELIKGLGAYLAKRGLKTKMLLGDNSDATTYQFIYPALNDPATYPFIGAVSFHSWRGWDKETLQKWADAATKINRPLLVAEGSIDAQAWGYPAIFEEPSYALQEINLYTRLLAICQPTSILQWQLTADYSPLSGGGIFGDKGPLRPTQRFWNLKQLAATPKGLRAMPLILNRDDISGAALGDNKAGIYVLHLVNNGTTRKVNLTGLPAKVKLMQLYITDKQKAMQEEKDVTVTNGKASFTVEAGTYTTLRNQ